MFLVTLCNVGIWLTGIYLFFPDPIEAFVRSVFQRVISYIDSVDAEESRMESRVALRRRSTK